MIGSLAGTIQTVLSDGLLLDVGGVGYLISVLPSLVSEAKVGSRMTVVTHLHVRENDLALYGFATKTELAFFRMLIEVPGVGPKSAMSILALAPVELLVRAISGGDAGLLTKVSGIGRKTAERIVVELKTRLEREHPVLAGRGATPHADVMEALVTLGYSPAQAREAVGKLPVGITSVEEGIRAALHLLGQSVHARR